MINADDAICSTWLDDQAYGQAYFFKGSEWWLVTVNVRGKSYKEWSMLVDEGEMPNKSQQTFYWHKMVYEEHCWGTTGSMVDTMADILSCLHSLSQLHQRISLGRTPPWVRDVKKNTANFRWLIGWSWISLDGVVHKRTPGHLPNQSVWKMSHQCRGNPLWIIQNWRNDRMKLSIGNPADPGNNRLIHEEQSKSIKKLIESSSCLMNLYVFKIMKVILSIKQHKIPDELI